MMICKSFLSTPSVRRATAIDGHGYSSEYISIHALREEGDQRIRRPIMAKEYISIHALREEGDAQ